MDNKEELRDLNDLNEAEKEKVNLLSKEMLEKFYNVDLYYIFKSLEIFKARINLYKTACISIIFLIVLLLVTVIILILKEMGF